MSLRRPLLPLAVLAGLTAASARADDPSATARADFLKERVLKVVTRFENRLRNEHPQPSVCDLSLGALAKLYDNDASGAEFLLRHMFTLQDMDPASPEYGMVPWQEGHPEIKDGNSVDFTMLPFAQIMRRFGDRISPEFRQEAAPHLKAAIAGIRHRDAKVEYTNIFLMQAASLVLLGEATGDKDAADEGCRQFDAWIDLTRRAGLTEYNSPTYTPVDMGCLQIAYDNTSHAELKPKLKTCLDYYWYDLAANYYAPRETLSGPESRVYNFLFGDDNINQMYYLVGLRQATPSETLLSDDARIWSNAATPGGYRPDPAILALAHAPERIVRQTFGTEPGQDRYNYLTPEFAFGTASAYYGGQDKQVSLEFGTTKTLPYIEVVPDDLDAPYGKVKTADKSGHSKPHHLKNHVAAVQERGTSLALFDLSPDIANKEHESVATNIVFPAHADAIFLDERRLEGGQPFDLPASKDSVVIVREGKAAAALRIFAAEGIGGQVARFQVKYDGNEWGAARLVAYHYQGGKRTLPAGPVRSGVVMHVERCVTDAAFADFVRRVRAMRADENTTTATCGLRPCRAAARPLKLHSTQRATSPAGTSTATKSRPGASPSTTATSPPSCLMDCPSPPLRPSPDLTMPTVFRLAVAAFAGLLACAACAFAGEQPLGLKNPGFESGLDDWFPAKGDAHMSDVSTAAAHTGQQGLRVTDADDKARLLAGFGQVRRRPWHHLRAAFLGTQRLGCRGRRVFAVPRCVR